MSRHPAGFFSVTQQTLIHPSLTQNIRFFVIGMKKRCKKADASSYYLTGARFDEELAQMLAQIAD
jgi:hypothetical protein